MPGIHCWFIGGFVVIRVLLCAAAIAIVGTALAPAAVAAPYKNCTEARKAGDVNIPSSSDKYGPHLDRDGDGIACESR
ncbi:MAG: excalibur calcium-binding domain-containing protein [Mycolicibacterium insubricum]|nr:excalibur calcium-binding domain-containing protein [Mycobacterium sp.]